MKDFNTILEMIYPALKKGLKVELSLIGDRFYIDLKTEGKSGCLLYIDKGLIKAKRRYDTVEKINNFDDLLLVVSGCCHGRSYFSNIWLDIFKENNMSDPRGDM